MRTFAMGVAAAAAILAGKGASAAIVSFEDVTCDPFRNPVVVGEYLIDSPEFITGIYSSSLLGAPDGPISTQTLAGFPISRMDGRSFFLAGSSVASSPSLSMVRMAP